MGKCWITNIQHKKFSKTTSLVTGGRYVLCGRGLLVSACCCQMLAHPHFSPVAGRPGRAELGIPRKGRLRGARSGIFWPLGNRDTRWQAI